MPPSLSLFEAVKVARNFGGWASTSFDHSAIRRSPSMVEVSFFDRDGHFVAAVDVKGVRGPGDAPTFVVEACHARD